MIIHTQLFLVIVLNSLACLGVHCVTREGMLFGFIPYIIRNLFYCNESKYHNGVDKYYLAQWKINAIDYILKPLFDCPPCMASVWGLLGWFYFMPSLAIVPYILVLCGVNALISKIYYYGE